MNLLFTNRVERIIELASGKVGDQQVLTPSHLFIAMCEENSGVCAELFHYFVKEYGYSFIHDFSEKIEPFHLSPIFLPSISVPVSPETRNIIDYAEKRMHRYNQMQLNEGHLMQALLKLESGIFSSLTEQDKNVIQQIVCTARDLFVHMDDYEIPLAVGRVDMIKKATLDDKEALIQMVEKEFESGWLSSINNGFEKNDISIYLVKENQRILGFACYESHAKRRGTFGPMGVVKTKRQKGIGEMLLHHCLAELKSKRYKYVVIEGAGPIGFYEKACDAVVIPLKFIGG
ncbi:GNAT family N-acetyltransferase [Sutcliffiella halmapala]|uniref:GNAT family N-acetyltransferase n=1 Tax=Sutcliffiella halmapala TaxID=79882 RepID=UPI000994BD9B|nr:GNAT family N-acetyltransferase [Sutcliffiella halmapala]